MATVSTFTRKPSMPVVMVIVVASAALAAGVFYLNRPPQTVQDDSGATADAKAYLSNLELSDVKMQATENFMHQQVVEVLGSIANHGPRKLSLIEVYCLFSGVNGKELYRERVPVVHGLGPHERRSFRLPFDSVPDGWNQAMPRLVVAKISFAS